MAKETAQQSTADDIARQQRELAAERRAIERQREQLEADRAEFDRQRSDAKQVPTVAPGELQPLVKAPEGEEQAKWYKAQGLPSPTHRFRVTAVGQDKDQPGFRVQPQDVVAVDEAAAISQVIQSQGVKHSHAWKFNATRVESAPVQQSA